MWFSLILLKSCDVKIWHHFLFCFVIELHQTVQHTRVCIYNNSAGVQLLCGAAMYMYIQDCYRFLHRFSLLKRVMIFIFWLYLCILIHLFAININKFARVTGADGRTDWPMTCHGNRSSGHKIDASINADDKYYFLNAKYFIIIYT